MRNSHSMEALNRSKLSLDKLSKTQRSQSLHSHLDNYPQSSYTDNTILTRSRQTPRPISPMNQLSQYSQSTSPVRMRSSRETSRIASRDSMIEITYGKAQFTYNTRLKHLTIKTHGAPCVTETDRLAAGHRLAKQVDAIIKNEGFEVNKIILQACYSAQGGIASQAQQLANHLNINVAGYLGKYSEVVLAGAAAPAGVNGGIIKTFQPMSSSAGRRMSSSLNRSISSVVRGAIQVKRCF